MDMQWYEEARTAVTNYRSGQQQAHEDDQRRAKQKAG